MKKQSKEQGNALAAMLIAVVILLIATLGYVFWNKYSEQSNTKNLTLSVQDQQADQIEQNDTFNSISFDPSFENDISFRYPNEWTVKRESENVPLVDDGYGKETYLISSPSKNIVVRASIGQGGLGGACAPIDNPNYKYINVDTTRLNNGEDFVYAQSILQKTENTYVYEARLQEPFAYSDDDMTDKSHCEGYLHGVISYGGADRHILDAGIYITGYAKMPGDFTEVEFTGVSDVADLKRMLESEEFMIAKQILLSASAM